MRGGENEVSGASSGVSPGVSEGNGGGVQGGGDGVTESGSQSESRKSDVCVPLCDEYSCLLRAEGGVESGESKKEMQAWA